MLCCFLSRTCIIAGVEHSDVSLAGDAAATGAAVSGADEQGAEMDLRERIYELVRPSDWTAEATEPAGKHFEDALTFL